MATIKCGYCSKIHNSVAEVRECGRRAGQVCSPPEGFKILPDPAEERAELVAKIGNLLAERVVEKRYADAIRAMLARPEAETTIHGLRSAVSRLQGMDRPPIVPGLYRLGDDLYQVLTSKTSGRPYAKLVRLPATAGERPVLEYAPGIVFRLTPADLVPLEGAQEVTRTFGWCIFGHFLTNPKSIARGMGPICASRYGVAA